MSISEEPPRLQNVALDTPWLQMYFIMLLAIGWWWLMMHPYLHLHKLFSQTILKRHQVL